MKFFDGKKWFCFPEEGILVPSGVGKLADPPHLYKLVLQRGS